MSKQTLGVAIIQYDGHGIVISAKFEGKLEVDFSNDLTSNQLTGVFTQSEVQNNADMALAGWFNTLNNIELSDRVENPISSKVLSCEKYQDGKVAVCKIEYYYGK